MHIKIGTCLLLLCLQFTVVSHSQLNVASKTNYSPEVEARIAQVENNLGVIKFGIKGKKPSTIFEQMAKYNIKGVTVAVIKDYQVEWAKGYGWADASEKRPVNTETLFQPGSISKSLNALGVLKLVQDKKLNLDTDINEYLKSWKFPYDTVSHGKKITIANLLSHTAGLTIHGFPGYYYGDKFPTVPQILDGKRPANTGAVRSEFEPGLKFQYSGGGTMISELIEMDVTGKPYDQYIREAVFEPLGMNRSFFTQPPPESIRAVLSTGYGKKGPIKGKFPLLLEQAAGGLWTTPTELAKFIIDLQLSAQGKSNKILTQEMANLMLTPYVDKSAAFGVFIDQPPGGGKYFQHSAGNQGFCGIYYGSLTDGNGVIIFANSDYNQQLLSEFVNSVANVYKWKGMSNEQGVIEKEEINLPEDKQNMYAGVYREDNGTTIFIEKKDDGLWYSAGWSGPWKMYFSTPSSFINLESRSEKEFKPDSSGKLTISRSLDGKVLATASRVETMQLPIAILDQYAGNYAPKDGHPGKLFVRDGSMWLDDGEEKRIHFISAKEFITIEGQGAVYTIIMDTSGKIEGINGKSGSEEIFYKRTSKK